jgi:predicted Zn-dependent peptidase
VRIDLAGTEDAIAESSAELLYRCYARFYKLNKIVLAVTGSATAEEVLAVAERLLKPAPGEAERREFSPEPPTPAAAYCEEALAVGTPQFMLGFKEDIQTPERSVTERLSTLIILDILAGKASDLYKQLLDEELINTQVSLSNILRVTDTPARCSAVSRRTRGVWPTRLPRR